MKQNAYLLGLDVLVGRHVVVGDDDTFEDERIEVRPVVQPVPELPPARVLRSELPGVPDEAWTDFVCALKTQLPAVVSASNEYGMFAMKPKRLADLEIMENLRSMNTGPKRKLVWFGDWVAPFTEKGFLSNPKEQYLAFVESMRQYAEQIDELPDGMSLSGALAVLHRSGPNGLANWNDEEKRFPDTVALFERTNGLF